MKTRTGLSIAFMALAAALTFASCTSPEPETADNLSAEVIDGAQYDHAGQYIKVKVTVYGDLAALNQAYRDAVRQYGDAGGSPKIINGFNLKVGNDCEIHVMRIPSKASGKELEVLGHEMAHCLYGSYHN